MVIWSWDWCNRVGEELMGHDWRRGQDDARRYGSLATELEVELLRLENEELRASYKRLKQAHWDLMVKSGALDD